MDVKVDGNLSVENADDLVIIVEKKIHASIDNIYMILSFMWNLMEISKKKNKQ